MHLGRLLLVLVLLASSWLALPASAELTTPVTDGPTECFTTLVNVQDADLLRVQTGCCYGNGGVCGCSTFGPVMCCDGRLSATCMCRDGSPVTTLASMPRP